MRTHTYIHIKTHARIYVYNIKCGHISFAFRVFTLNRAHLKSKEINSHFKKMYTSNLQIYSFQRKIYVKILTQFYIILLYLRKNFYSSVSYLKNSLSKRWVFFLLILPKRIKNTGSRKCTHRIYFSVRIFSNRKLYHDIKITGLIYLWHFMKWHGCNISVFFFMFYIFNFIFNY